MTRPPALLIIALAMTAAPLGAQEDSVPQREIAKQLASVAGRSTLQLTTFGRKTGKPHTVTVWFVVGDTTLYLSTLDLERDWPRNVRKNSRVELAIDTLRMKGRAAQITDVLEFGHVVQLLQKKYWLAWFGGWLGRGPEGAFRVEIEGVSQPTS